MENGPFIDGLPIKNGDFPCLITGEYTDVDHFARLTIPSTNSDPENDHSLAESMFGWGKVKCL